MTSIVATTTTPVATTEAESTTTIATAAPSSPNVPEQLGGFELATVALDGRELLVAVADSGELRRRGLMGVETLGDLDGMIFVFDRDTTGGFWMKDTLVPLDIAFFTAGGAFVDGFSMEPCITTDCPTYRPNGAYRYALEVPRGEMPEEIELLEFRPGPSQ
jgi:uncharacterized membrane protein (UPF0127 family)